MRVSKVNVKVDGKDTMVLMHRSTQKGALVYEPEIPTDRTQDIIPGKKRDSFKLSIENKTLVRRESLKRKDLSKDENEAIKEKYKTIESIIKYNRFPTSIKAEDILPYLNHKFHLTVKYYKDGKWLPCNLSECIVKAVERQDKRELQPYNDWKEWYIESKSEHLRHSIAQNKIETGDGNSKRQQALLLWEPEFVADGKLKLEAYHALYNVGGLLAELCKVSMGELRDNDTPRDTNAYHRNLKRALQSHQATVFGKRESPHEANRNDIQLAIYHLEVVKYLEHYFPIKKSGRRNTADDIAYYLNIDTLKNTITHQLENAVRANVLRKGKYQRHTMQGETSSSDLINLKRNEAFALNLISTSAFAANNIRNIVDPTQTGDVLVKGDFQESIEKKTVNIHAFRLFFPVEVETVDLKTLWAMRGAVQQIRNQVAHYKTDTLNRIFDVQKFEFPDVCDTAFGDTVFAQAFAHDIANMQEAFALQLKSGGVLSFYTYEQLSALLSGVEFQLCRSVIPFAPGFKKVMKEGVGKQNAKQDEQFYDMELNSFKAKDDYGEEAWSARYFLMKLIYNYLFLPMFLQDEGLFSTTVSRVLAINKAQAQKQRNKNAMAFADVRAMRAGEPIADYMAYVQSQWMQEQAKKKEEATEETRINFEKFVLQLFVKGFDTFLDNKRYAFVQIPQPQINLNDTAQQQAEKLNELQARIQPLCSISRNYLRPELDEQIAFYVYCRLLDANHLSMLRNEMIKFNVSSKSSVLLHQLEIIELCLLNVDVIPTDYRKMYPSRTACLDRLKPYLADGTDYTQWGDLYVQTDKETPVVHAGIELSMKYGTANLLQQLIASQPEFRISDANFDKWNNLKKEIAEKMKQHTDYHQQWVTAKEQDDEERRNRVYNKSNFAAAFVKQKGVDYINNCIEINNYNWLDNKLHFNNLKSLQNLTIEILGRMAGFVVYFDRDFQYLGYRHKDDYKINSLISFQDVLKSLKNTPIHDISEIKDGDISRWDNNEITEKERTALIQSLENKREVYRNIIFSDKIKPYEIRNHIAHFNYLTQSAAKYSLIDLINRLRELLHYDRKLKNAVSQSIIKLFDKHGMILKLQFDVGKHELKVESIEPKKLYHLGTKAGSKESLTTNQVQTAYCKLCKALLVMKK